MSDSYMVYIQRRGFLHFDWVSTTVDILDGAIFNTYQQAFEAADAYVTKHDLRKGDFATLRV